MLLGPFACFVCLHEQQTGMPRLSEGTELTPDSLLLPVLPAHTPELLVAADINLTKDLLYDKYTHLRILILMVIPCAVSMGNDMGSVLPLSKHAS